MSILTLDSILRRAAFRSGRFIVDRTSPQSVGLIGWWPLGVHGGLERDFSGFGNHGTRIGSTRKVVNHPRWGGVHALDFDGTDDYSDIFNSEVPPVAFQNLSDAITISAWINPDSLDSGDGGTGWTLASTIIELRQEGTTGIHVPFSFGIYLDGLAIGVTDDYTVTPERRRTTEALSTGVWQHGAITVNGDALDAYIDSVPGTISDLSTATGDRSVGANASNMQIGLRSRDGGEKDRNEFNGRINDVRIYNRPLSRSEISEIYNEPWRLVYPLGIRSTGILPASLYGGSSTLDIFSSPVIQGI